MTRKEQTFSLIRHLISAVSGLAIAYGVADSSMIMELTGAAFSLLALVWAILDKTATSERIEVTVRHVLTTVGAFWSKLTPDRINQIIALIMTVAPIVLGQIDAYRVSETRIQREILEKQQREQELQTFRQMLRAKK